MLCSTGSGFYLLKGQTRNDFAQLSSTVFQSSTAARHIQSLGEGVLGVSHIVFRGNGGGTSRRQQSIKGGLNKVNFIMTTKILPLFLSLSTNRIMILTSCSFFNFKTILFQLLHFPTVYHIDHFCGV